MAYSPARATLSWESHCRSLSSRFPFCARRQLDGPEDGPFRVENPIVLSVWLKVSRPLTDSKRRGHGQPQGHNQKHQGTEAELAARLRAVVWPRASPATGLILCLRVNQGNKADFPEGAVRVRGNRPEMPAQRAPGPERVPESRNMMEEWHSAVTKLHGGEGTPRALGLLHAEERCQASCDPAPPRPPGSGRQSAPASPSPHWNTQEWEGTSAPTAAGTRCKPLERGGSDFYHRSTSRPTPAPGAAPPWRTGSHVGKSAQRGRAWPRALTDDISLFSPGLFPTVEGPRLVRCGTPQRRGRLCAFDGRPCPRTPTCRPTALIGSRARTRGENTETRPERLSTARHGTARHGSS